MLINPIALKHISPKIKFKEQQENLQNNNDNIQKLGVTSLKNMQNYSYLIGFGANNENMQTLFSAYKDEMPDTLRKSCDGKSEKDLEQITDVYGYYNNVYADMEQCHTVEELKERFPQEFKNLNSALDLDIRRNKGSFLSKIMDLATLKAGENLFPETGDNDLSVYLAKKVFFEVKTKKEIEEDFLKDINKNLVDDVQDYLKTEKSTANNEKGLIPYNIYTYLGLTLPKANSNFRASLLRSRTEFIEKNKSCYRAKRQEDFNNYVRQVLDQKLDVETNESVSSVKKQKNTLKDERRQYAMFLAWNNLSEVREDLSKFSRRKTGVDFINPDFMELAKNPKSKQSILMKAFWEHYPEHKINYSIACSNAYDIVNTAIIEGTFPKLKEKIDAERLRQKERFEAIKKLEEERLAKIKLEQEFKAAAVKKLDDYIFNKIENEKFLIPKSEREATKELLKRNCGEPSDFEKNKKIIDKNFKILDENISKTIDTLFEKKFLENKKLIGIRDEFFFELAKHVKTTTLNSKILINREKDISLSASLASEILKINVAILKRYLDNLMYTPSFDAASKKIFESDVIDIINNNPLSNNIIFVTNKKLDNSAKKYCLAFLKYLLNYDVKSLEDAYTAEYQQQILKKK